jgi:predicted enzyme related to lactoylglutathione lyase
MNTDIKMIRRARYNLPRLLMSTLLLGASTSIALAATFELPALNTPPSGEHHVGKVVWLDLVTPDLAAAEKFYGPLFGWTFQHLRAGDSDYAVALLDGRPIAGLLAKAIPVGEHRQSAWLTFIAVRDVDAAKRVALAHGAKVLADPSTYAMRGRQAVLSDPQGAVFAILASSSGDPPDYLAAPGEWIWSSLLTKDAGTDAAFYQELFGYDVFEAPSNDGLEHLILSGEEYARASANALASTTVAGDTVRRHPHWLNFVHVESVAQMTGKVIAMGGRVLVEPHIDRGGNMLAVVADPAGAPFGLMEWSGNEIKAEPK